MINPFQTNSANNNNHPETHPQESSVRTRIWHAVSSSLPNRLDRVITGSSQAARNPPASTHLPQVHEHPALSKKMLERSLRAWINATPSRVRSEISGYLPRSERPGRKEAAQRIRECINQSAGLLDLSSLELTSLPESILKSIPSLRELNIFGNHLSAVNLSGSQNLTTLTCTHNHIVNRSYFHSNDSILDVSNCHNLRTLSIAGSDFANININACDQLESLNCTHCRNLDTVDLSTCINLVQYFIYSEANITPPTALAIERGREFETLGRILRYRPEQRIERVQYQKKGRNEGAIDMGGPLRECFTQAYEQALNALMKDTPLQGARKDIDHDINAATVEAHTMQLGDFGRLLAHVADQPKVNLPPHLFEQSFEAILTLAKHSHALGIEGQNSSSDLLQSATQTLCNHKAILVDIVESLLPEIKTSLETHFDDPLAKYADALQPTPADAKALLAEYLSDHLEQALGLCYSPESDTVTLSAGNSRFLQLALIAHGFNTVRESRTRVLNSVYPTDIKALATSIKGSGDIRRALSDPNYEKTFSLTHEAQTIHKTDLDTFKHLIHQWASKSSDQQLSAVCRAITGSDVLPDRISNGTNQIVIQIQDIPVLQPYSDKVLGYAEFSPHTCFGTLEIAPHVVQEVLAEHEQSPEQIPARLKRLLDQDLPSENQTFNTL